MVDFTLLPLLLPLLHTGDFCTFFLLLFYLSTWLNQIPLGHWWDHEARWLHEFYLCVQRLGVGLAT